MMSADWSSWKGRSTKPWKTGLGGGGYWDEYGAGEGR